MLLLGACGHSLIGGGPWDLCVTNGVVDRMRAEQRMIAHTINSGLMNDRVGWL
jgi:hypothetical protein